MTYEPHDVVWTPSKIRRFWNDLAGSSSENYFSRQAARAVLRHVQDHIASAESFLDLGCGPGFLLESIAAEYPAAQLAGADDSETSIDAATERLRPYRDRSELFLLPAREPEGPYDAVFMLETIEHLPPDELDAFLKRAIAHVAADGVFVATVPHDEDVDRAKVRCPDCGARFHPMQHMTRWTPSSLQRRLEAVGLTTISCAPTLLQDAYTLGDRIRLKLGRVAYLPNLVYIGRRSPSSSPEEIAL